jgi:hypothetical protein
MPKKDKAANGAEAAGTDEAKKEEAAPAPKKVTVFVHTGKEPTCKLAPQAAGIVNILKEAGKEGLNRADLTAAMDGVIETRQPQGRILSYYQKLLVESEAVTMTEVDA